MLKIATLSNMAQATELCDRLAEAGIEAHASHDVAAQAAYLGGAGADVWVLGDADTELARAITEEFIAEVAGRTTNDFLCSGCRYDLRGHEGEGRCPECWRPFRLPVGDVRCRKCDEKVPADFEICWKCGAEIDPSGG